jgi:ceramide glucosyltransferase
MSSAEPLPVSILKPLCGLEPRLYENLRSFCEQDYPEFEIVFGVRDPADPAIEVVRRLQREFPNAGIDLVIDSSLHGANYKVSNLINILPRCKYEFLVVADSDIHAGPDYLTEVIAPLLDPKTGVVTCLYRGRPAAGFWPRMGSLFIDGWFAPSVWVAHLFGSRSFAFGATIAVRRDALEAAGGFAALADHVADDYWLGEYTRRMGFETVLSRYEVTTDVTEADPQALMEHELRWLRVIRSIQPLGFAFCFVTFASPAALIGYLLARGSQIAAAALLTATAARIALHGIQARRAGRSIIVDALLAIPRDFLTFAVWCLSFASWRVRWGPQQILVSPDGIIQKTV